MRVLPEEYLYEARNRRATAALLALLHCKHPEYAPVMPGPESAPEPEPEQEVAEEVSEEVAAPPAPVPAEPVRPTIAAIGKVVCGYYKITWAEFAGSQRPHRLVRPRHVAFYLCKKLTTASLPEIGKRLGGKDHTSVIHGVRRITEFLETDTQLQADIAALMAMFKAQEAEAA